MNTKKNQKDLSNICKTINKFCKLLNNSFYINHGGCCYVAYLIAKNLESLNINFQLCICGGVDEYQRNIYFDRIKGRCRTGVFAYNEYSAGHFWIKVGNKHINKDSCLDYIILNNINSKDLLWLYNRGCWNPNYNFEYNTTIKKLINFLFKEL